MKNTVALCENRCYTRMYRNAKSYVTKPVVVYYTRNKLSINRLGITTGKKLGVAVKRNRARRIIRETYRFFEKDLSIGWDFIFVARSRLLVMKTNELIPFVEEAFKKCGALKKL